MNIQCRDAARVLSEVRDAQVLPQSLAKIVKRLTPQQSRAARALQKQLRAASEANIKDTLRDTERLAATVRILERARRCVDRMRLHNHGWRGIRDGLTDAYRSARAACDRVDRTGSAAAYHEWRKRAKDVRYHVEMLADARPLDLRERADELHEVTDLLGDEHDMHVLSAKLRREAFAHGETETVRTLTPPIVQHQRELRERALRLGHRLLAQRPARYETKLHTYWKAWRAT